MKSLKVVLLGNSNVGKTSIVQRFAFDKSKDVNAATLGAMFISKYLDIPQTDITVKFNLWDTAGQEKYHSLAATYYKDAVIAFVVYDITCKKTFEGAKDWIEEVRKNTTQGILVFLVGNKLDLINMEQVDPNEARVYTVENNISLKLVSARNGEGIKEMFIEAAKEILSREEKILEEKKNTMLKSVEKKKKIIVVKSSYALLSIIITIYHNQVSLLNSTLLSGLFKTLFSNQL